MDESLDVTSAPQAQEALLARWKTLKAQRNTLRAAYFAKKAEAAALYQELQSVEADLAKADTDLLDSP
jgi:hypothetical protein